MNKLIGLRSSLGLTQSDMAEILKISKQSYWNKENGKRAFSAQEMLQIRDYFRKYDPNLTVDQIFFSDNALNKQSVKR